MTQLTVVGLGYIGLPTAAVFAQSGVPTIGVDVNEAAVAAVNAGTPHIFEPGLDEVVHAAVRSGLLRATTEPEPSDAFIIAVPTPFKEGFEPDLGFVEQAVMAIAPLLVPGNLIVLESTSPVGATEQVAQWLAELRPDLRLPTASQAGDISLAYCPERVLPGNILHEIENNDRLLGGVSTECAQNAANLYKQVVKGDCHLTNARTAELAKLTENAFRDVNIAFANELSTIARRLDIDVWELIRLANLHPRVNILQPGPGVGGHCIAVDPWFIVHSAPEEANLIRQARLTNDQKPALVIEQVLGTLSADQTAPTIACLGLAYKPNIDDLRESPAIDVVQQLRVALPGATIVVVEPNIDDLPESLSGTNVSLGDVHEAIARADAVVALVAHAEFLAVDAAALAGKSVIDTVGIWRDAEIRS